MTNLSAVSQTTPQGVARSLARVEKSSASSGLHDDTAAYHGRDESASHRAPPQGLSRSETEDAPRWHGPRLAAPFVAQILGQVIPGSAPDALSASAAYGHAPARIPAGICFDSEV